MKKKYITWSLYPVLESDREKAYLLTVADPGPLPCSPNWGPKGRKKFFLETGSPPLSQGLGDRPPSPYLRVWILHWLGSTDP